ncbi:hypothetical protein [Gimesia aquarii]|uniref:Uncharacterized protein n=1 Tax=Gimesia aquarii TaxID=2527964 RepID=A0A517WWI8_9PLAN|nr:hypothetical protein [Gimesia aquarii]QDU09640.1 hypothetical protein V202x_30160 [Gimesia aquarii]
MSQEHRLCAEIYARLFSHVDQSKRIAISPDGKAHLPGFPNLPIPDLCITFKGKAEQRIEAKLLEDELRRIKIQPNQRTHWFNADCEVTPHFWLIATTSLDQCWLLDHEFVSERMATKIGENIKLNLWPNMKPPKAKSLDEISSFILSQSIPVEIIGEGK